ncbi:MAG: acyl-CoA dehydrogenase family protein, partial [Rhodospirillales bacterium]|nr:acyl-CoA dehydrogenase family protein [Rhodospirillales bacterium]
MSALDAFRSDTRTWLEANCPPAMRTLMPEEEQVAGGKRAVWVRPEQKLWLDRMAAKGWTAPTWPKQYGGGGLSPEEALVLEEEMQALGCRPPLRGMGLSMLGPVLLEYGTEEQRRTHLPKIVTGEIRWCQGYSEPEAGSDLASLRTRAVLQGDHFLVNGHKIWTSNAHLSDWIFCLVRTDPAAKKQEGISFLLIDMKTPGITVRPIITIDGGREVNEVFFDNVEVPAENLVGQENKGWDYAKFLLGNERTGIARVGASKAKVARIKEL